MLIFSRYDSTAVKVWCPDEESEPEGLFNKASCPDTPANWFREPPDKAAELYALERFTEVSKNKSTAKDFYQRTYEAHAHKEDRIVHVLDDQGKLHKFKIRQQYDITQHTQEVA